MQEAAIVYVYVSCVRVMVTAFFSEVFPLTDLIQTYCQNSLQVFVDEIYLLRPLSKSFAMAGTMNQILLVTFLLTIGR